MTSSNGESSSATATTCAHAITYAVRRSSAAFRAPRHAAPSAPVAASAASASTRRRIPRAPLSGLHGTGRNGQASRGAGYDPPVRKLTIEGRRIADDTPCFVIAEIGHNHQGSVEQAKKLFRAARDAGVDAVKLQKRDNAHLFTRELYDSPYDNENSFGATYGLHREALELDRDAYAELRDLAAELDLVFFATAFDEASADLLAELGYPRTRSPRATSATRPSFATSRRSASRWSSRPEARPSRTSTAPWTRSRRSMTRSACSSAPRPTPPRWRS